MDSGCGVEVCGQAAGVEGRQVGAGRLAIPEAGSRCWCWGQAAKAEICRRVMTAEGHSMAALKVAAGVAALVVVALEGDDEELAAAAGSGGV